MTDESMLLNAVQTYRNAFDATPELAVFAPGRVNLIGEHVDYNDGFVLPFALPHKTIVVGSRVTNTTESAVISITIDKAAPPVKFTVNSSLKKGEPSWANYVKGPVYQYLKELPDSFAFNAVIVSNVPFGSGLSSSAALEVAISTLLEQMCGITKVSGVEKAKRCQKAEHDFVGTPCGIMDQYISAMGQEGHLLLIDCRDNDYKLIPFGKGADSPVMVVTNSNVKHSLSDSEYPTRVKQCKEAVKMLQMKHSTVKALRDATMVMLEDVKGQMSGVVYNRAKHCITEDIRTLSAVESLATGDYNKLGKLMTASHESLRDDYEVSCVELDLLVATAVKAKGVYGSRMTGGGFGGCTVTLVERSAVDNLIKELKKEYQKVYKKDCECYTAAPASGAGIIDLKAALLKPEYQEKGKVKRSDLLDWVVPVAVVALAGIVFIKLYRK